MMEHSKQPFCGERSTWNGGHALSMRDLLDHKSVPMSSSCRTRLRIRVETQKTKKRNETLAIVVTPSHKQTTSQSSTDSISFSDSLTRSPQNVKVNRFTCHSCGRYFTTHSRLHAHIALEHGKTFVACSRCAANSRTLWRFNVCRLCGQFASKLSDHEAMHYRDKDGINALFECSKCYRSFYRFNELKRHLADDHRRKRVLSRSVNCEVCSMKFYSRHARDQHFVTHFKSAFENIWQTICSVHEKSGDVLQSNECPLCKHVMTNKRSLRRHVISRHMVQLFRSSETLFDDFKLEQSNAMPENSTAIKNVNDSKQQLRASVKIEEDNLDEVNCGLEGFGITTEEHPVERSERFVPGLEGNCCLATVSDSAVRRELKVFGNEHRETSEDEVVDRASRRDEDVQSKRMEQLKLSSRNENAKNNDRAGRVTVGLPANGTGPGICQIQPDQLTFSVTSSSDNRGPSNQQNYDDTRVSTNKMSGDAMEMRERLISLCMDRNATSPRCVHCESTFERMFDFEVHLVRTHLSSLL